MCNPKAKWAGLLVLTILLAQFSSKLHATETTGTIFGTVVDQSGRVVPNAKVTVVNLHTAAERTMQTDDHGNFLFPLLPVGSYEIRAEKTGFQTYVRRPIVVTVNAQISISLELQVGSVAQQVTVSGQTPLVNTRTATVGYLVNGAQMEALPLNGRNVLQLTFLAGGVLDTGGGVANQAFVANSAKFFPSGSGGRADSVNYIFDGGTDGYRYTNVSNPLPNPDAVQEFSFMTNNYSAEYGSASGGIVNTVSKSGTNQLHGTAFDYVRNAALNATNFFSPGKSDNLRRNQPGFSVGGPAYIPRVYNGKDKTFFFVSWQDTIYRQAPISTSMTTLTAAERSGDLSRIASAAHKPVLDPLTGQPFPNNIIPQSRFDPVISKFLPLLPVSNPNTGLVTFRQATTVYNEPQWFVRIDQQISPRDQIMFHYFYDYYHPILEVDPNNPLLTAQSAFDQKSQNITLSDTHIISPKFIANWNVTINRYTSPQYQNFLGPTNGDLSGLGIIGVPPGTHSIIGLGTWHFGFEGNFQFVNTTDYQYQLSMTRIAGRHELKWGADYIRSQLNQARTVPAVNWTFSSAYTNFTQASLLLGFPSAFAGQGTRYEALRQNVPGGYLQDDFKVSKQLTLNMGIRWDPYLPWVDQANNAVTLFRPGLKSIRFPNLPAGAVVAGDPGVPRHGYSPRVKNFSPRAGFAWDPTGKGRMSIRAAAGLFYGQSASGALNQTSQSSFPFTSSVSMNPSQYGYGGLENPFGFGTAHATYNPFLVSLGVAPGNTAVPFPLQWNSVAADFNLPLTYQWNFSLEKQLGTAWLLQATYVGSQSTHLEMVNELNPAVYIPGNCQAGEYGLTKAGPCSSVANYDYRRPYGPALTALPEVGSDGNSNFNALTLTLKKSFAGDRWWSRSQIEADYTWSHSLDVSSSVENSGASSYRDPFNRELDYGNSDYNRFQRLVISGIWSLPALSDHNAMVKRMLGRWNVSTIVTLESGLPFSVTSPLDNAFSGLTNNADQILANASSPGNRSEGQKLLEWFNTSAFTYNTIGTFGTSGRNILSGPGMADVDASLYKDFSLSGDGTRRLELRGDFFNLFNYVNFNNPNTSVGSPQFGEILSAGDPRILQLALKLFF